jgi:hypothetical protein
VWEEVFNLCMSVKMCVCVCERCVSMQIRIRKGLGFSPNSKFI